MNNKVKWALFAILVLLSIMTGVTKLIQMPEEMELFRAAGFTDFMTILFGSIQIFGGLLLLPPKTRKAGALIMAATFSVASIVVFIKGMMAFGVFSLLFIALAVHTFRNP